MLGGIIQKRESEIIRKVPLFGDIPGLGWLFKKKDTINKNVELMVFLSPRITRTPEQVAELLEEVESKTPNLLQWRREKDPPSHSGDAEATSDGG